MGGVTGSSICVTQGTNESGPVAASVSLGLSHLASRCGPPSLFLLGVGGSQGTSRIQAGVGEGRWSTLAKRPLAGLPAQESASHLEHHGKVPQS